MVPCREGDGEKPHPSAPFRQHWIQSTSTGLLSGPVPVTQLEGADKALFHIHLLDFVINRLTSEALPTNFVRVALPFPCRNGSKSRDSVPLWKCLFRSTPAVGLLDGIALLFPCRNGSKSRESVPLRKCLFHSTPAVGLLDGTAFPFPCRNGSKSRESVPLWKCLFRSTPAAGLLIGIALPSPCRNGSISHDSVPLRYSIKMSKILTIFKKLDTLCVNNRQLGNLENQSYS